MSPRLTRIISRLAAGVFIVCLPLLLVTTNVRLLVSNVGFYERGLRAHDAAETTGISQKELDRAAGEIVEYFENDASVLRIVVEVKGQETSLFNEREVLHMEDVKGLVRAVFRVQEFSLAFVLVYVVAVFLWSREGSLRALAWQALGGIGVGVAAVGVIGVLALTGFDATWRLFHEIAFRNDLWQLSPATDRLIQMFPEPFWEEATLLVAGLTLGEAALVVVGACVYLLTSRGTRDEEDEDLGFSEAEEYGAGA